jgi:3D (Asp-Asp-Asp) domain-containing protein
MVVMAGAKGWEVRGRTAVALRGATLSGLAEAITGNGDDWRLLDFKRDPRTLQEGERVGIRPLLEKAVHAGAVQKDLEALARQRLPAEASPPAGLEKGEYLGTFRITVYNTAREWDHPAIPTRKAPGLAREYSVAFLKDIDMQGSGIDRQGRLIQHTWAHGRPSGYTYVETIRTASGEPVRPGWSAAVDKNLVPHGIWIYIDRVGWRKTVDTGRAIKERKIDVYMAIPLNEANDIGTRDRGVWRAK